jgi:glucose/arabinose dehydrogenase
MNMERTKALRPIGCAALLASVTSCGADVTQLAGEDGLAPTGTRSTALLPQPALISALELSDIRETPAPILRQRGSVGEVALPIGSTPAQLSLAREDGEALLELIGHKRGNRVLDVAPLALRGAVRVRVTAGSAALTLPPTDLDFVDQSGQAQEIYLPALSLAPNTSTELWVASDGSTYAATPGATSAEFATLLRPRLPWRLSPDFNIARVATGFERPLQLAFVPAPGAGAHDPAFYVLEQHGSIAVVLRDGSVSTYATGLLNFDPVTQSPGAPNEGLGGVAVDPDTGDLYVTLTYSDDPTLPSAPHYAAIERLTSTDGGHTSASRTRIRSLAPEREGAEHFISDISFGPDGLLYVYVGDAGHPEAARNLDLFHGKVLRLTRDGGPTARNPYYNAADGISARDYVYASGLSNPHGSAWRLGEGSQYFVETGTDVDRLARTSVGHNFGWDGTDPSLVDSALYNWNPSVAPRQIAFVEPTLFAGSGFPNEYQELAYVTQSGGTGMGDSMHKAITEWTLASGGELLDGPRAVAIYRGSGAAAPTALAAGPDGLYFSDFSPEDPSDPEGQGASVLRLSIQPPAAALDCNQNGTADTLDLSSGTSHDCNLQRIPDECDIASGRSRDCDADGQPDECEAEVPLALDLGTQTSSLTLSGAALLENDTLELQSAAGAPASASQALPGSLPLKYFRIRFDAQVDASASDGLAFALFDASQSSDAFGIDGPAGNAIVVALDATTPEVAPEGSLAIHFGGQLLGRYTPSFALFDGQPHTVEVLFDAPFLSVNVSSSAGEVETAFQALTVPDYAPFVASFGFGTSSSGALAVQSIRNVLVWRPTVADANANGRLDSCECLADFDDGEATGTPDGIVNDDDLRYFLSLFGAGAPAADLDDGSGTGTPDGVVSIEDIRFFLQHFRAGC